MVIRLFIGTISFLSLALIGCNSSDSSSSKTNDAIEEIDTIANIEATIKKLYLEEDSTLDIIVKVIDLKHFSDYQMKTYIAKSEQMDSLNSSLLENRHIIQLGRDVSIIGNREDAVAEYGQAFYEKLLDEENRKLLKIDSTIFKNKLQMVQFIDSIKSPTKKNILALIEIRAVKNGSSIKNKEWYPFDESLNML